MAEAFHVFCRGTAHGRDLPHTIVRNTESFATVLYYHHFDGEPTIGRYRLWSRQHEQDQKSRQQTHKEKKVSVFSMFRLGKLSNENIQTILQSLKDRGLAKFFDHSVRPHIGSCGSYSKIALSSDLDQNFHTTFCLATKSW
jgi:hypothetical protein